MVLPLSNLNKKREAGKLTKLRLLAVKHPDRAAIIIIALLFIFITAVTLAVNRCGFIWGSDRDWKNQHFAIPEYFRMRFYETHDLFPDFALQIGGGQNIYNYSYYGIANPLYLPAYALPFVKMSTYIQIVSLMIVLISAVMSYYFFKGHFRWKIALTLGIMFLCSGGLFYHSHHHIMFMNYFPFLIGMLIGCRGRTSARNLILMSAMSYCIMCTSFYFSVGCFSAVFIYMIYLELQRESHFSPVRFIKNNLIKIIGAVIGCLCSAFMWMPTIMAIISGREKTAVDMTAADILLPNVNHTTILYSGYSMGLTVIVLFAAVYMLIKSKRQARFLSLLLILCAVLPIINCTINAFMYIDGKSFLPLGPVMLLAAGHFFSEKQLDLRCTAVSSAIIIALGLLNILLSDYNIEFRLMWIPIFAFSILTPLIMILICRYNKERFISFYAAAGSLVVCLVNNYADTFAQSSQIKEFYNNETNNTIISTIENDPGMYRFANNVHNEVNVNHIFSMNYLSTSSYSSVNNSSFREFRFNTSLSENRVRNKALQNQPYNILFSTLMGCRYRLSSEKMMMYNEEMVADLGQSVIYRNNYAFPLGYAASDVMGENTFNSLPSYQKAEAMLNNIIIPGDSNGAPICMTEPVFPDMTPLKTDSHIKWENGIYTINSPTEFTVNIPLNQFNDNKIIIVTASANNIIGNPLQYSDVFLIINGVKNKLTDPRWKYNNQNYNFTYVLSSNEITNNLELTFSPGFYTISDLRVFALDSSILSKAIKSKDELIIDRGRSLGDIITGIIDVTSDGWFNISLPYDDNFRITVDGSPTDYYRTNTAFIGFPIKSGRHKIEITFEAPMKKTGMITSLFSVILLILTSYLIFIHKRKS